MANQLLQFRTEKGKEGIGFMGHVYRFGKRGTDGSMCWRCLLRDDCKGRLATDNINSNPSFALATS
jgi:FLYWCH zinc finger domain